MTPFVFSTAFLWRCLLACLATGILSLVLTRLAVSLLPRLGFIDKAVHGRHIHDHDTPRGGGLAIVCAFVAGLLLNLYVTRDFHSNSSSYFFDLRYLLPLLLIVPLGLLDDRFGLSPVVKLMGQILAAVFTWHLGLRITSIFNIHLGTTVSLLVTVFWLLAFINAYNLIDGVDGLATGLAIISAICIAITLCAINHIRGFIFTATFAAAALGFLRYNFHPASIFLGDTGSMSIGFLLGIVGLLTSSKLETTAALIVPLLACGVPLIDTSLAIWRRITYRMLAPGNTGKGVMAADRLHIHHRLLHFFHGNQVNAVLALYFLAVLLACIAVASIFVSIQYHLLFFAVLLITFSVILYNIAVVELWNSARLMLHDFSLPHASLLVRLLTPLYDLVVACVAFYLSAGKGHFHLAFLGAWLMPVMLVLILSRTYRVIWKFPTPEELFRLIATILLAFFTTWVYAKLPRIPDISGHECLFAAGIASVAITLQRLAFSYLRSKFLAIHNHSRLIQVNVRRVLLCGVSKTGRHYLDRVLDHFDRDDAIDVIGFIDPHRFYRRSYCFNLKVLGDINDLAAIYRRTPFQGIVVTRGDLTSEEMDALRAFCKEHQIQISRAHYSEEPL